MLVELARQIANVCKGDNRQVVNSEAAAVVAWAAPVVDKRVIEESIGWAKQQADPPLLPRMLAGVILKKARDSNIPMHPFQVKTR